MNKFLTLALAAGVGSLAFATGPAFPSSGNAGNMAWATVPVCAEVFCPISLSLDPGPMCFGKLVATDHRDMSVTLTPGNYEKDFHGCVPLLGNWTMVPTVKGKKDKSLPLFFLYTPGSFNKGCKVGFITSNAPHGLFMGKDTFNFKLGATLFMPKNTRGDVFGSIHVLAFYI